MTRGAEREVVTLTVNGEETFAIKLTNDELRQFRVRAEKQLTIFGDGTHMHVRASDVISIVEELLQRRKNDGF